MCIQAVGLVQAAIERVGVSTVSITLLRDVTEIIRPPRALSVPFKFGYPLGKPNEPEIQHAVIGFALNLLVRTDTPVLEEYDGSD